MTESEEGFLSEICEGCTCHRWGVTFRFCLCLFTIGISEVVRGGDGWCNCFFSKRPPPHLPKGVPLREGSAPPVRPAEIWSTEQMPKNPVEHQTYTPTQSGQQGVYTPPTMSPQPTYPFPPQRDPAIDVTSPRYWNKGKRIIYTLSSWSHHRSIDEDDGIMSIFVGLWRSIYSNNYPNLNLWKCFEKSDQSALWIWISYVLKCFSCVTNSL